MANPVLNRDSYQGLPHVIGSAAAMTQKGAAQKTLILAILLAISGGMSWYLALMRPEVLMLPMLVGGIGGFIVAMVTVFKKSWAPYTAPLYAVLEGLILGGVSALYEGQYHGIVLQAVMLTLGTLFVMQAAFSVGLIKATEKFKMGVMAATGGIALVYLVAWGLSFFGIHLPFLYDSSPLSIGISAVVVIVAALNLVLDFDFIEQGARQQAPKYMEWYAAFGLMVTLIWLYLEILRLLSKLQSRK